MVEQQARVAFAAAHPWTVLWLALSLALHRVSPLAGEPFVGVVREPAHPRRLHHPRQDRRREPGHTTRRALRLLRAHGVRRLSRRCLQQLHRLVRRRMVRDRLRGSDGQRHQVC